MSLLDTTIGGRQIPGLMTEALPPLARRAWVRWAVAGVVLAAGYVDLALGGETIAPILLVIGYCVLVPLAILS
jgi:energy-converting hydrogenase Eha subunit C